MKRRYTTDKTALEWKWARFNPIAAIDPQRLVQALDSFDQGWLRDFALIYHKQEETDALLAAACPKRRGAAARLPWEIAISEGFQDDPEAKLQQEFLNAIYSNLVHRDAIDLDYEEGIGGLVDAVLMAQWLKKDVHELVWTARGADLSLEAWHVHLALFENTSGRLRYTPQLGTLGTVELRKGEWMVASGYGIGQSLSIASMFKSLGLKDWIAYNELVTQFGLHGKTSAAKDSAEWTAFKNALEDFGPDWAVITGMDASTEVVLVAKTPDVTFGLLHEKMEAAQARIIMGSDLSTLSRENGTGASLQAADQNMILENDARRVSETFHRWLDVPALEMRFGRGVTPLCSFRLIPPVQTDDKLEMEKDKHLKEMGLVQSIASLADKWGVDAENMQDTTATQAAAPKSKTDLGAETLPASNAFDADLHPRDQEGKFAARKGSNKQENRVSEEKLSPLDKAYFAAIDSGDMETVQVMVDQAAMAAGYTKRLFRGGPPDITEGQPFSYFTDDEDAAASYGAVRQYFIKEYAFDPTESLGPFGLKSTAALADAIGIKETGDDYVFEALDRKSVRDQILAKGIRSIRFEDLQANSDGATMWATLVVDPSAAKFADPITRDSSGEIIPLSQRFDPKVVALSNSEANTSDGLRAAVRADLQPLRALLADAVQSGEAPDALDWDRVTEQVLSGTQVADALNEEWLAALVRAHGGTEAELRALLAEVITLSTNNDDTTEP